MEDKDMLPTMRRTQANWLPSIFNDFFDYDGLVKPSMTSPAINVIENQKEYKVEMAAPGMSKDNFKIRLTDENQLCVSMERKEEHKEDADEKLEEKYLRREFSYSKFEQALLLPEDIKKEEIKASMENGVLTITIPKDTDKPEMPKERFIDIL